MWRLNRTVPRIPAVRVIHEEQLEAGKGTELSRAGRLPRLMGRLFPVLKDGKREDAAIA